MISQSLTRKKNIYLIMIFVDYMKIAVKEGFPNLLINYHEIEIWNSLFKLDN